MKRILCQDLSLLEQLPLEIISKILVYCYIHDIPQFTRLSKSCYNFCECDQLWHTLTLHQWPNLQPLSPKTSWQELFRRIYGGPYHPCVECGKFPLEETRFECLNCDDGHVCSECEAKEIHPTNHILMKTYYPEVPIQNPPRLMPFYKVHCSRCKQIIGSSDTLINEKKKPNRLNTNIVLYQTPNNEELCEKCMSSQNSSKYWKLKAPIEHIFTEKYLGKNLRGANCDINLPGCLNQCYGVNWICVRCSDIDVCQNCELLMAQDVGEKIKRGDHTRRCAMVKMYRALFDCWAKWTKDVCWDDSNKPWWDIDDEDIY